MLRTAHDLLWRHVALLNWIALSCGFCLALLAGRMELSGRTSFFFLSWNLALAVIPLCFAWAAQAVSRSRWKLLAIPMLGPWLLFFPNAPYILTDLMHLKHRAPVPLWYDLVMLLAFALTGLFVGYLSLHLAEDVLKRTLNRTFAVLGVVAAVFLSAFGIYLGRMLRWNSWDVVYAPRSLAWDIAQPVLHPFRHEQVWLMTALLGVLLISGYYLVKGIGARAAERG